MKLFGYQLGKKPACMQKSFQSALWANLAKERTVPWASLADRRAGFTFVEMMLMVTIVILVSIEVFTSFSGLKQASVLKRSAQELSFNIRRAQNMALAVAPVVIGGSLAIPQSVGIRITPSSNDDDGDGVSDNKEYFFFSDQNGNGKYDSGERIEPAIVLPDGMQITSITGSSGLGNPQCHIIFYTPEARVALTRHNGNSVGSFMDVILTAPSGDTITVRIRISGQVSVL